MKFPKMRPQPARELKIPDLAGGLNLRDGVSEIMDNQLTDSVNMWWQDGILKTRPGLDFIGKITTDGDDASPVAKSQNIFRHNCYKNTISGKMQLVSTKTVGVFDTSGYFTYSTHLNFFWCGKGNIERLPSIKIESDIEALTSHFVVLHNEILYCFTSEYKIYKLKKADKEWAIVGADEIYSPILYAHCKNTAWSSLDDSRIHYIKPEFKGDMFEGINLIGDRYRMIYSSMNKDLDVNYMVYKLGKDLPSVERMKDNTEYEIKVAYTNDTGKQFVHKVIWNKDTDTNGGIWEPDPIENNGPQDDLRMYVVFPNIIKFYKHDASGQLDKWPNLAKETVYIEDNLEITAPYEPSEEEKKKVFCMTQTEWFGGYAEGLSGGTRLFLCGNTSDKEKALVTWSGLNEPLFFPENGNFYVSTESEAVTGFGKQSDMLVIFKEYETWFTRYYQNTEISAEDLINQSVIDYSSTSVYFTLTNINSSIGCCNPDTVQLCRNRLVWLGSDGKVYTLVSDNQYNERAVFCVSEMIERSLNTNDLQSATSTDWNGYYCIGFGSKVYLMDYNCYGYTHISSYSKTDDANKLIPWYYWEFPSIGADELIILSLSDLIFARCLNMGAGTLGEAESYILDLDLKSDISNVKEVISINSSFTTKLFDFGEPSQRKNIDKINIQLGNNEGVPIKIELITECGNEETEITLEGADTESYGASFIESKALFPCIRQVIKMGLKLSSDGVIAIDGMSFKYRKSGGAR